MKIKTVDMNQIAASLSERLKGKTLNKQAHTMPASALMGEDLDPTKLPLNITRSAAADDILEEVHPRSVVLDNVATDKELATIETKEDAHEKIMKSTFTEATGRVARLAGAVNQLSVKLATAGHADLARNLDSKVAGLYRLANTTYQSLTSAIRNIVKIVFQEISANYDLTNTEQTLIDRHHAEIETALSAVEALVNVDTLINYPGAMRASNTLSDTLTKFYHSAAAMPGNVQSAMLDVNINSKFESLVKVIARVQSELTKGSKMAPVMDFTKEDPSKLYDDEPVAMDFTNTDTSNIYETKKAPSIHPMSHRAPVGPAPTPRKYNTETYMEGGRRVPGK